MIENHSGQWHAIQTAVANKRFSPALFFSGPLHCNIPAFAIQSIQLLLCDRSAKTNVPCFNCPECRMIERMEHPDIHWVKPEKNGSAIKIDQIRELHSAVFLTPQRASYRIIIIESADKMNNAASNALLKILEEPPSHTHFILIAEQISTVLPTILSRCQLMYFSANANINNLLELGTLYPEGSERALLVRQSESLLEDLIALIEKKQHPCSVALQWNQFELNNLLWFLYLVYSQVSYLNINKAATPNLAYNQLMKLKALITPIKIFEQIDKINKILKKLSHNININNLLALEDLFFSLADG